jgi:hypothetical protein
MSRKSIAELLTEAAANLADNTTQQITAAKVRVLITDFLDCMKPAYGVIRQVAALVKAVTATPSAITPFDTAIAAVAPDFVNILASGAVQAVVTGVTTGRTTRFICDGTVEGQNNQTILIEVYKNGAPTGWSQTCRTTGVGRPESWNIVGLTYDTADVTFDVRVSGDAGNYTFSKVTLLCENVPVASFV